jgi:hypothetical protein
VSCPLSAPYSPAGSVGSSACSQCVSGCDTTFGQALPGPTCASGWTPWLDPDHTEGSNSCIRYTAVGVLWDIANSSCAWPAHLLTSSQVNPRSLYWPFISLPLLVAQHFCC